MTDLVERLRAASHDERLSTGMLYREAADEIERLRADRDRLAAECKALSDQCQDVRAQRDKAQAELSAARESLRMLTIESAHKANLLQAELSAARAAVRNCIRAYFIVVTA